MGKKGKRIVFYSQHLIGVGHHFRNREIVRALARHHEVSFIDGGRAILGGDLPDSVEHIRLAPVYASQEGLAPEESDRDIQEVLQIRKSVLCETIKNVDPDVFLIEFFPFDRWAFRSELISAIDAARSINPDVKVICSLRDIPMRAQTADLVGSPMPPALTRTGRLGFYSVPFGGPQYMYTLMARRYYAEVCPTLNAYFDALFVHGDPKVTRLEEHFPWVEDIEIPIVYTGYVSEKLDQHCQDDTLPQKFVLVSAGGGAEAYELIMPCIEAWKILQNKNVIQEREMVICTGPFLPEAQFESLKEKCEGYSIQLKRFVSNFPLWMLASDFSISRAGYNTCMNVLETGTPSLLIPSVAMGDQVFRAHKLAHLGLAEVIAAEDVNPNVVADAIQEGISQAKKRHDIALDGAMQTLNKVSEMSTRSCQMVSTDFEYLCEDRLKVCLITFQYPPEMGGVGVATQRIARNLARSGVSVHVIAPGTHAVGEPFTVTMEDNVVVHRTHADLGAYYGDQRPLKDIGSYAVQLHRQENFDVIHGLFLNPSGLVAANVALEIGLPFVASIRGSDWEVMRYSPLLASSARWVIERADLVTSVSSAILEDVQKVVDISQKRCIPNAFDPSPFDGRSLKEIGGAMGRKFLKMKRGGQLVIGTVASIAHKKGHPFLFDAFRLFCDQCPDALLLMVGDFHTNKDRLVLTEQIKKMGLTNNLFITGRVPHSQVLAWIKEMDIFAFPSLHEGSPNALLEAMACGLPVVATAVGGICDLIEDKQNGLLVPSGCADALFEKLMVLAQDKDMRNRLGQAAGQMIKENLTPAHEAKAWVEVYKQVMVNHV